MIGNEIGRTDNRIIEIMHWDSRKHPPSTGNEHWNCRAINFKNVTYPDGTSTRWINESVTDGSDRGGTVKSISIAAVARPVSYPLLIDSSRAGGGEIFRIDEGNTALKQARFTKAFDNSKTPPVLITL